MSERAQALADRFEQANEAIMALLARCSDEQWQGRCEAEGWTVAATAHHIANGHEFVARLVRTVASGGELPAITMEMIDRVNAQEAEEFAACDRAETIELLRQNGAVAAELVRRLSDEQLARSSAAPPLSDAPLSVQTLIEGGLIGHLEGHGASLRATLEQ